MQRQIKLVNDSCGLDVWSFIKLSLIVLLLLWLSKPASGSTGDDALINEVLASHTGTDNTEFIEIFGTPGFSLGGLSLIIVESDAIGLGTIDRRLDFGPGDLIGSNGFFLVGNPAGLASVYGVTPDIDIATDYLENSSLTVALVETASIAGGTVSGAEVVLDAVALTDGGAGDSFFFDAPVIGPDGTFFPSGARRVADGADTDAASDWVINDFNLGPGNTPTSGDVTPPPPAAVATIMEIQGAGHISPLLGESVETEGIVTAVAFNGFYMQDKAGDGNVETSDGIFVFSGASVESGDEVTVTGLVAEDIPGGASTGNLSTTSLIASGVAVESSGNVLPVPVLLGKRGRIPPAVDVISEDEIVTPINLQDPDDAAANLFDPHRDGIDFFESLEGMRVKVERPVAVSPSATFSSFSSEVFTLVSEGKFVSPHKARTKRGGILLQPHPDNMGDQNPERVQIQFDGTIFPFPVPEITVGDVLDDVTGVVGYNFGNFEVNATEEFGFRSSRLKAEKTSVRSGRENITVASYNVLNLSPDSSDDAQRQELATQIVGNLKSPDVIALQEIQDNSGETDDGTVDASLTLEALAQAIIAEGGPDYDFVQVDPVDGAQGGVPGGNIRNAYLYNPARVSVVEFKALTPGELAAAGVGNPNAFDGSRIPLLARFGFNGKEIVMINNHLSSRSGSTPIFGGPQPFIQAAEDEREAQALSLHEYVEHLTGEAGDENVVVLGDFNTFEFTNDLAEILPGGNRGRILYNLVDELRGDNAYTFIFDGNSQVLDHMFVTWPLLRKADFDIVHVNADFPTSIASDHEPIVASFELKRSRR